MSEPSGSGATGNPGCCPADGTDGRLAERRAESLGSDGYPPEWHTTIKHAVRAAHWRILTVHHLDGDKTNCRWWNLAALCQRCHLTVQGRVVMARVWPWEHSEWFRPYVAGFYAWSYLGEDLSREAVEARLGELLALERQA